MVKSAQRVIEVLEFFASEAAEATVKEVADAFGYPQSSTSLLLATLETLGYLQLSPDTRKYTPTLRVMLLGARLQSDLFGNHNVLTVMERLRVSTQQTIMLGLRQHIHVRIVVSLRSPKSTLKFPVGSLRPVCHSAIGKVLLAALPASEALPIIRYANAKAPADERVEIAPFVAELNQVREQGWAISRHYPAPNLSALAVPVVPLPNQPALALNLGTTDEEMQARQNDFIADLTQASTDFRVIGEVGEA